MKRFVYFFLMSLLSVSSLGQEKRVALIIGNSQYSGCFSYLNSPKNDANAVNSYLKELGFETHMGVDVRRDSMSTYLEQFRKKANGADMVLFYFSGHAGIKSGKYYLAPSGDYKNWHSLASDCYEFSSIENTIKMISAPKKMYIIDACKNSLDGTKAPVVRDDSMLKDNFSKEKGTIYCFSTGDYKTADSGIHYSVFTKALIDHIADFESFDVVWRRIARDVTGEKNDQRPYYKEYPENLMSKIYFNPNRRKLYHPDVINGIGYLTFNVTPSNAIIKFGNSSYKNGEKVRLKYGYKHEYKIYCDGYETYENSITIWPGKEYNYTRSLTKKGKATLNVKSNKKEASVYLDGIHIGYTPLYNYQTLAGTHDLTVVKNRYYSYGATSRFNAGPNNFYAQLKREWPWFWSWDGEDILNVSYHFSPKYQIGLSLLRRAEDSRFSYGIFLGCSPRLFSGIFLGEKQTIHLNLDLTPQPENYTREHTYVYADSSPYSQDVDPYSEAKKYDGNALMLGQIGISPFNGMTIELGLGASYHCDKYYMKNTYDLERTIYRDKNTQEVTLQISQWTKNDESRWYNQGDKWSPAMRLGAMFAIPISSDDYNLTFGGGYTFLPMNMKYSSWDASVGWSWCF